MKNNKRTGTNTMPKKNKQKIAKQKNKPYIIIAAMVIFIIGTAIFMSFPSIISQSNSSKTSNANEIKSEALKLINSDSKKAKELFQQALAIYQLHQDTNNIVDTKSLIYLIDHKQ